MSAPSASNSAMLENPFASSYVGMAVLHRDGDPGVVTAFGDGKWRVAFCSGFTGTFPPESLGPTGVFVWFPDNLMSVGVEQKLSLEQKLELLSNLFAHVKQGEYQDCRNAWAAADCADWFPLQGLDGAILRHEARAMARQRAELRAKVSAALENLEVEEARKMYDESGAAAWWTEAEFAPLLRRAEGARNAVDLYVAGPLWKLDVAFRELVSARLVRAEELADLKVPKVRLLMARIGASLSREQLTAIASPCRNRLITARAGSGKTHTLAALAALTIQDEQLLPDQILTLAFNRKAAAVIGERIRTLAGVPHYHNARTFHGLAHQLAKRGAQTLIFDDGNGDPSRRKQSQFVERVIHKVLDENSRRDVYEFFRRELEQAERLGSHLEGEEYLAFRRAMSHTSLAGELVKSTGEKFIADYFFEHDVAYTYEQVYSWDKANKFQSSPYRPDFCITHGGKKFILEHWALDPDDRAAEVPDWWETSSADYRWQINEKRAYWKQRNIPLIETHAGLVSLGRAAFEGRLRELLTAHGIASRKLAEAVLVEKVANAPRTISRLAELFLGFISRAKKRGWRPDRIQNIIDEQPDCEPRARIFHRLATKAYAAYERELASESAMDFDDLLAAATEEVRRSGGRLEVRLVRDQFIKLEDLRWIFIDEFQDFSELYYQLVRAVIETNPDIRIVAVGDDWQAINGFAGAQLAFFQQFEKYFPATGKSSISTNRRSDRAIVGAGNWIMSARGSPACGHRIENGHIERCEVDRVFVSNDGDDVLCLNAVRHADGQQHSSQDFQTARALKACADFLKRSIFDVDGQQWLPNVMLISRTGYAYGRSLNEFEHLLRDVLAKHPDFQLLSNKQFEVEVITAHRSKGKEADTVIILEANGRQFPKIHADNQLFGPFGVTIEDTLAEERRLFYVAISRAKHRLLLLTDEKSESAFLKEMKLEKGFAHLLSTASKPSKSPVTFGTLASKVKERLRVIGEQELILHNISPAAKAILESLGARYDGFPTAGHTNEVISSLHAELAWPNATPPVC